MTRYFPYTADDLRYLADKIDEVMNAIGADDLEPTDWRWGLTVDIQDDVNGVAGQLRPYSDGWIGFYPRALTKEDSA